MFFGFLCQNPFLGFSMYHQLFQLWRWWQCVTPHCTSTLSHLRQRANMARERNMALKWRSGGHGME